MLFQDIIFEFVLPFFLFFLITLSLLRKSQIFKDYTIEFGISIIISLLGSYWLYINKLSSIIISSSGMVIFIIFVLVILVSIALKGYKKIEKSYEEIKKEKK
ncbi:MAG: hypothetical protein QXW04_00240 [Candidatus Aenigmatarchaeota archaeon]